MHLVGYTTRLTATQIAQNVDYLAARYGLYSTPNHAAYIDGDSLSSQYGSMTRGWVGLTAFGGSFNHTAIASFAVPGKTLATGYSQRATQLTYLRTGLPWGAVIWLGTNDLSGCANTSGVAAVYTNLTNYVAWLKTQGAAIVEVATMLPRSPNSEACREVAGGWNPTIRSGASTYGYTVIDIGGDATIGCGTCNTNMTNFQADNTHLTDVGQAYANTNYWSVALAAAGFN